MDIATEALKTLALTNNYNQWIFELFMPYSGEEILEVGCGLGNLTQFFKKVAKVTCIDKNPLFIEHMKIDHPDLEFYHFDITEENILFLANKGFDMVLCVNVLEHIRDDEKALSNMFKLLKPGGRLLLYVPALNFLYGTIDRNAGHFKRYDKAELEKKLKRIGFHIERIFFHNFLGALGWFINGRILKRKKLPILQTILFDKFTPIFAGLERKIKPPFGLSLVTTCKKPESEVKIGINSR